MKPFALLLLFAFFAGAVKAQKIQTADEILTSAYKQAAGENKKLMVVFHASWCGWCRKMDTSLVDPSVKPYFDKNFVITHLTVYESENKKGLENPGALEFLTTHGGNDQGL